MPYDKQSFLAGVAAGRNMESWPALDSSKEGVLIFTVLIDPEQTSMRFQFSTYLESGLIDWGDGTVEYIQQRRFLHNYHDYSAPGIYNVRVTGILLGVTWSTPIISPSDQAMLDCLISVNTPIPDIPEDRLPYVVDAIYTTTDLFSGCRNLVAVHPKLFRPYTREGVTFCVRPAMFQNCKSLKTIPAELFRGVHFRGMAQGGTLTEPALQACFSGCSSLRSIPEGLLDNPSFEDCENIQSIFEDCRVLTDFPDNLFSGLPYVTNCAFSFKNCVSITKRVPDLWNTYPNASGTQCFRNCTNAANYADIPDSWK